MERIGVGIIGVGLFGENHARLYQQDPRTEAGGPVRPEHGPGRRSRSGARRGFRDRVCRGAPLAREDIQAVLHRDPGLRPHRPGPGGLGLGEARALREAPRHERRGGATGVPRRRGGGAHPHGGLPQPVQPAVHAGEAAQIDEGEIGRVRFIHMRLSDTLYVPTRMLSWAGRSSVAWFLGSHCVDLVRWLTGAEVAPALRAIDLGGAHPAGDRHAGRDRGDPGPLRRRRGGDRELLDPRRHRALGGVPGAWATHQHQYRAEQVVTVSADEGHRALDVLTVQNSHGRLTGFAIEYPAFRGYSAARRGCSSWTRWRGGNARRLRDRVGAGSFARRVDGRLAVGAVCPVARRTGWRRRGNRRAAMEIAEIVGPEPWGRRISHQHDARGGAGGVRRALTASELVERAQAIGVADGRSAGREISCRRTAQDWSLVRVASGFTRAAEERASSARAAGPSGQVEIAPGVIVPAGATRCSPLRHRGGQPDPPGRAAHQLHHRWRGGGPRLHHGGLERRHSAAGWDPVGPRRGREVLSTPSSRSLWPSVSPSGAGMSELLGLPGLVGRYRT